MTQRYHLAQINIARGIAALDDPRMQGFVGQLDTINALADNSEGFVWRLETEDGDATAIKAYDDERMIINVSVWDSFEALKNFVYRGDHLQVVKDRAQWFDKLDTPALALWWIPAGTLPSVEEATAVLRKLAEQGSTAEAFTFAKPYPKPGLIEERVCA